MWSATIGLAAFVLIGSGFGAEISYGNASDSMQVLMEPMTWSEARAACLDRGLDLVLLDSSAWANMAGSLWEDMAGNGNSSGIMTGPWIGLTNKGGTWRWHNGVDVGAAARWEPESVPPSTSLSPWCAHLSDMVSPSFASSPGSADGSQTAPTTWSGDSCTMRRPAICGPGVDLPVLLSSGRFCPRGSYSPTTLTQCAILAARQGIDLQPRAQNDCKEEPCLFPDVGYVRGDPACFVDETVNGTLVVHVPEEYANYLQSCSSCEPGPDVHYDSRALCILHRPSSNQMPSQVMASPSPSKNCNRGNTSRSLALVLACLVFGSALAVIGIVLRQPCNRCCVKITDSWWGPTGIAVGHGVHATRASRVFDCPVTVVTCDAVTATPVETDENL